MGWGRAVKTEPWVLASSVSKAQVTFQGAVSRQPGLFKDGGAGGTDLGAQESRKWFLLPMWLSSRTGGTMG